MKRIATMQDISCIGKCSLTVALPILSAMGVETAILPTAVLSTHTMFQNFTFHDLTNEIPAIQNHWQNEQFTFDALYTGYLGSIEQIDIAHKLFETYPCFKLVDPCMADHGKLYTGFNQAFVQQMKGLCAKADLIVPNLTEACFLLDEPYKETYDETYIKDLLKKLTNLGATTALITGVSYKEDTLGASYYNKETDTYYHFETNKQPQFFHGTGDIFASCILGALQNDLTLEQATNLACLYVSKTIEETLNDPNHRTYGVNFEQTIPYLLATLKTYKH